MGAPKPFTIPTPTVAASAPVRTRGSRVDHGPNFFLQPIPPGTVGVENGYEDGWLALSYSTGMWFDIPCDGEFVQGEALRGKNKGQPVTRLVGPAKEITRQLREAADELGIGVAIEYQYVTYKSGAKKDQEIPGKLLLQYLGKERKQRRTAVEE